MRRPLSTAVLAILAALVWAPLMVSAASPDTRGAASSPLATPTASIPASLTTNGGTVSEPGTSATAAPAAPTASVAPAASVAAAATTSPAMPDAGSDQGVPASNGPPTPTSTPAARIVAAGAPLHTVVGAPATPPTSGSDGPAPASRSTDRLPGGLSQVVLLAVIGVALVALVGIVFLLLAAGDRRGAAPSPGAAEGSAADRTVRRTRIRPADDPILRAMGLGEDAPGSTGGQGDPDED